MASKLTTVQYRLLNEIAESNGLSDYQIDEHSTTAKGDNYLGQILCITIRSKDKKLDIVVKKAPTNENFRKSISTRLIFLIEIHIYEKVFDTFLNFQNEYGVENPFNGFPKFHGKCDEEFSECLLMDDLKKCGYSLWNRLEPMNAEHIALVMKEYAKFHAVSYAMKRHKPELFRDISKYLDRELTDPEIENVKQFLKFTSLNLNKAVEGNSVLEAAYQKIMVDVEKYFLEELRQPKDKYVITHGDCWCNNLMFKYENSSDAKQPTKVCLLDWQISRVGLPILDITYFFSTSSPKEILDDYQQYLKIYYDTFSQNLKQMECDPEEVLSFNELKSLWRKCAKYGFLLGGFIFNVLYADSDNAPDVSKNTESTSDFYKQFEELGHEKKVKARIIDLLNYIIDNDFL